MKIDSNETRSVAAAANAPAISATSATVPAHAPRVDLYVGIHKALRALMTDTLVAVGRMDTADDLDTAQITHRVLELMDFCIAHLGHENEFIHTAIEARASGASGVIARDHEGHEKEISRIARAATGLLQLPGDARAVPALALYRELALFIAHNFEHMHVEETAHNAVLWSRYTDAELVDIHNRLVASIPPAEMMFVLRWLVPFMNPAERLEMMADMQRHAPPPAFEAALEIARPHLSDIEWGKLMRGLGLPPVPGLVTV
ncbi:hemerythrin domain-containing protein [Variovorax sp. VNK109]|uniref:hemerythrin domain-containing protein n=1 Tax=Variovorax sp. VNK109 TaxID=3400919 RepID=UPI003C0B9ED9